MERVHCPRHVENTPSCVIYPTHAYCYGGCGRIELSELGKEASGVPKERYKENLEETRQYIGTLPTKTVRGFSFPYDDRGYYLCFPGTSYYKRRNWADGGNKYKNPAGHAQPMFIARQLPTGRLFLCEGEINSLSVAEAFPDDSVMSPGSASDFKRYTVKTLLTYCIPYSILVIMVDRDGPGTEAAIHAKGLLVGKIPDVRIVLMDPDPNDWLCSSGKEKLRQEVENKLSQAL